MADAARQMAELPDLLDFDGGKLYFDEPTDAEAARLVARAGLAENIAQRASLLAQADALAPDDLTVIVALYRFHYFTHEFAACLAMADRAMQASARRLNIPADWRLLTAVDIERAGALSMPMLRFYLWALKGRGYLQLRLGRFGEATAALDKLVSLDVADRLNARALLALAREHLPSPTA
jgi:tetratricopeptide (TPR) repeat protein